MSHNIFDLFFVRFSFEHSGPHLPRAEADARAQSDAPGFDAEQRAHIGDQRGRRHGSGLFRPLEIDIISKKR